MYSIMTSANKDSFTFNFPVWMPFISFSCVIAVARTTDTRWKWTSLVSDLKGKIYFYALNMMLAVGLSYVAFIMLRYDPSIPTLLRVYIINGCLILSNALSSSIDMTMWLLCFILFVWCITFWFVVPTLCSWNQSRLIMLYDLLDALLYLVC